MPAALSALWTLESYAAPHAGLANPKTVAVISPELSVMPPPTGEIEIDPAEACAPMTRADRASMEEV